MKCRRCGTEFEISETTRNCPKCGTDLPGTKCSYLITDLVSHKAKTSEGQFVIDDGKLYFLRDEQKKTFGHSVAVGMFGLLGGAIYDAASTSGLTAGVYKRSDFSSITKETKPDGKLHFYELRTLKESIKLFPAQRETQDFERQIDDFTDSGSVSPFMTFRSFGK